MWTISCALSEDDQQLHFMQAATNFPIGMTSLCTSCCNTTPRKPDQQQDQFLPLSVNLAPEIEKRQMKMLGC